MARIKKITKVKPEKNPALEQDFPQRLTELESELRTSLVRPPSKGPMKDVEGLKETTIGREVVIQFDIGGKVYATGHTDVTYSGANHARGVRHIRLYFDGEAVLDIEGDYEDQQFGSNFRFQNIDLYKPGEWETGFLKFSEDLRHHNAQRSKAFKKQRAAERRRN